MTTYTMDIDRRADEIGEQAWLEALEESECDSALEFYDGIVNFFKTVKLEGKPYFEAEVLYCGVTGRVTDFRAQVIGHYNDTKGRFTMMLANGDKIVCVKPQPGVL
ncbi:hypothetical protein SEA_BRUTONGASTER_113 [Gordonia phage BrutonGaster]|uniref:Uncharacterized protein n=1 Tax=Gordonia phage BrutonGaster TaxID=2530116 RepID=A0A482JHA3_9CAUD|nr:hypothetical protein HOV26_gp069 [Gordonia phage BrutonGaster]QBP33328.1 hypothetical protein SEA_BRUTONGASTER_113 [Gordonia phage BrutonGaster]